MTLGLSEGPERTVSVWCISEQWDRVGVSPGRGLYSGQVMRSVLLSPLQRTDTVGTLGVQGRLCVCVVLWGGVPRIRLQTEAPRAAVLSLYCTRRTSTADYMYSHKHADSGPVLPALVWCRGRFSVFERFHHRVAVTCLDTPTDSLSWWLWNTL